MPENGYKVIAFDCDGVMFDTKFANESYYNSILTYLHLPPMTKEQAAYSHMHTVEEALSHIISDPNLRIKANEYRKEMTYLPFMKLMVIEPHLKPLLNKIRPSRFTAIATNRTDTMQRVLLDHGLTDHFDLVISASDVKNPKPSPDQLHKILEHFDITPSQMLYIGDSRLDELAATAAHVPFVAYDNSNLTADYHIKTLYEIEEILNL
ncbi:MAG: HAD family hydrolase [Desulfobacteraceae bacterium]|jgi:HAD superfamily hydrolase (TIGR01549 family)